jgi:hypothetical protein
MDLALIDFHDQATFQLVHPVTFAPLETADGKPVRITVAGLDSPAFRAAARKASQDTPFDDGSSAQEDRDEFDRRLYAGITVGWENIVFEKPLAFDPAAVASLYKRRPWIMSQIKEFVGRRENFLKA